MEEGVRSGWREAEKAWLDFVHVDRCSLRGWEGRAVMEGRRGRGRGVEGGEAAWKGCVDIYSPKEMNGTRPKIRCPLTRRLCSQKTYNEVTEGQAGGAGVSEPSLWHRKTRPSRLVSLAVPAANYMFTLCINHIIFFL
ncbi:hypothetical protein Naga_100896g1 [Nannochloropsis gaditana]|uniref:Uncharacterized protein n=1 Tax=Nannochloropsis gaditana TaxID=72520 RepID=W7T381_9STRA|nr:hypothetical protein Naga_100896g1 [Nannochloropsis gaditana]